MKQATGFTLIELMIVVAIIAILAAIAVPAYQDYLVRGQLAESITLTSGAKVGVQEYYATTGKLPDDNAQAGVAAPGSIVGKFVTKVEIEDGTIRATLGNQVNAKVAGLDIELIPDISHEGSTTWLCGSREVQPKYLPSSCRDDLPAPPDPPSP